MLQGFRDKLIRDGIMTCFKDSGTSRAGMVSNVYDMFQGFRDKLSRDGVMTCFKDSGTSRAGMVS